MGFPFYLPRMDPLYTRKRQSPRNPLHRTIVEVLRPSLQPALTCTRLEVRASSGPRLTDCTLFGSFPEPDRHTAASAKPFEFLPHRDFRSNGHYFPHI